MAIQRQAGLVFETQDPEEQRRRDEKQQAALQEKVFERERKFLL